MGTHIMSVGIKLVMTYGLILQGSKAKASAKKRKSEQRYFLYLFPYFAENFLDSSIAI